MADAPDRRSHRRKAVLWTARLHYDGEVFECEALGISDGGARIRTARRLVIGSPVMLKIARLGVFCGRLLWQRGNRAGIGFLEEVGEVRRRIEEALSASGGVTEEELVPLLDGPAAAWLAGRREERLLGC